MTFQDQLLTVGIDLRPLFNNQAATNQQTLADGRFNVWRNSWPADETSVISASDGRVNLQTARFDGMRNDNVQCRGQFLSVPNTAQYDWLYLLCASERRSLSTFVFFFTDGYVWEQKVAVSDLWEGSPGHGELLASRSATVHYPHHVQRNLGLTIWLQRVAIQPMLNLEYIQLPDNPGLHLFDARLVRRGTDTQATEAPRG